MGVCGCSSENEFIKIDDDNELVMEKFDDCPDCGGQSIQINLLKKKDRDCFGDYEYVKKKKLAYWMDKKKNTSIISISLSDFESHLKREISDTFESLWCEEITENDLKGISDKFLRKLEEEFTKKLIKNININ